MHNGDIYSGHYYSFQQPTKEPKWYKFNDEEVTEVTADAAINNTFGGEATIVSGSEKPSHANACGYIYFLS